MPIPQLMKLCKRIQRFGFVGGGVPQEADCEVFKAPTILNEFLCLMLEDQDASKLSATLPMHV